MIEHERFGWAEVIRVEGTGDNAKSNDSFKNAGDKLNYCCVLHDTGIDRVIIVKCE